MVRRDGGWKLRGGREEGRKEEGRGYLDIRGSLSTFAVEKFPTAKEARAKFTPKAFKCRATSMDPDEFARPPVIVSSVSTASLDNRVGLNQQQPRTSNAKYFRSVDAARDR